MKLYVGKDWKHFVVQNVRKVVASGGFLDLYLKWHIFTVQAQLPAGTAGARIANWVSRDMFKFTVQSYCNIMFTFFKNKQTSS